MRCVWRCFMLLAVVFVCVILYAAIPGTYNEDPGENFNQTEVSSVLMHLCDDWQRGVLTGDFCNRICFFPNQSVLSYYQRNKIAIVLKLGGQKVVLKSSATKFSTFSQLPDFLSESDFLEKVLRVVNLYLNMDWLPVHKKHLVSLLWPYAKRHGNGSLSLVDRRSLWSLVNQEEFLAFTLLTTSKVFPRVVGTCGHFYAVEYIIPFKLNTYFYGTLRSKILLHLSGTMKLFYEFLNEPLHWCDVKFENLGLHPDFPKRFVLLDGDMVFTDSKMQRLFSETPCKVDKDCAFFDCRAKCNATLGVCNERFNDNIEVFCKKLIFELYGNFWSKANKLLEACHFIDETTAAQRTRDLHVVWAWAMTDI